MQEAGRLGRQNSHSFASTSRPSSHIANGYIQLDGRTRSARSSSRVHRTGRERGFLKVISGFWDPVQFEPKKLTVSYTGTLTEKNQRRYTLTHNDITGALMLTVGEEYNWGQISGFYTRLLRDEVVAEWRFGPQPCLHIYCHVSGEERWLAPPVFRNYIFRREIPLVLDTFIYADRELLEQNPELASAEVYVHFQSSLEELDTVEFWGFLNQKSSWQPIPTSLLQRVLFTFLGQPLPETPPPFPPPSRPISSLPSFPRPSASLACTSLTASLTQTLTETPYSAPLPLTNHPLPLKSEVEETVLDPSPLHSVAPSHPPSPPPPPSPPTDPSSSSLQALYPLSSPKQLVHEPSQPSLPPSSPTPSLHQRGRLECLQPSCSSLNQPTTMLLLPIPVTTHSSSQLFPSSHPRSSISSHPLTTSPSSPASPFSSTSPFSSSSFPSSPLSFNGQPSPVFPQYTSPCHPASSLQCLSSPSTSSKSSLSSMSSAPSQGTQEGAAHHLGHVQVRHLTSTALSSQMQLPISMGQEKESRGRCS